MKPEFFRDASWLGADRSNGYIRLLAMLNLAVLLFLLATSQGGVDRNGFLLGTDFISFWTSGHMLHQGSDVYDTAAHIAAQRAFFERAGEYTAFYYPPPFLLVCYVLGGLPYFPALGLWLIATGAAFALSARKWLADTVLLKEQWWLLAAFPPVLITITHGQTSFLAAALLGGGAFFVRGRPVLAGVLFGLAIFKPQLGLLIPFVLLIAGEWRTISAAAATALGLSLLATLAFGPDIWIKWLNMGAMAQSAAASGEIPFAKMQSPFAAARLLGAPETLAMAFQGSVSLAVLAALVWAGWRKTFSPALAAAMLAGAVLATPFVLDYDLVVLAFPLAWLAAQEWRAWEKITSAAVFVAPAFARPLALEAGIPITVPLVMVFFVLLIRRAATLQDQFTRQ